MKITRIKQSKEIEVVSEVKCDNCYKKLNFLVEDEDNGNPYRCESALNITLDGGYGMFFDSDSVVQAVFCKECASKLMKAFPSLSKLIDEASFNA